MIAKRTEVGLVYLARLVQGVALVTFPAASSIVDSLRRSQPYRWCDDHTRIPGDQATDHECRKNEHRT
jgi:hypothetical protein